jgi:hypothetical protein
VTIILGKMFSRKFSPIIIQKPTMQIIISKLTLETMIFVNKYNENESFGKGSTIKLKCPNKN